MTRQTRQTRQTGNAAPRRRTVLGGLGAAGATVAAGGLGAAGPAAAASPGPGRAAPRPGDAASVTYRDKQLLIDGEPAVVLAGEIHYFRLKRADWQSRLDRAKEAGLNTIATYIPWMWHETPDGTIDVTGGTRPERDLGAFLDLCLENGFHVIARPGPFTMAELKGEGVPERVRADHPEIVPTGWDGAEASTPTVDYLAPAFLGEVRRWYAAVMPVIARRLHREGRPGVIACQLDNEIGMLAWVSNSPDLTGHLLEDFNGWLDRTYGDGLAARYPFAGRPAAERNAAIRSPEDGYAPALMHDLGTFMRGRFARYVTELRTYAEAGGVRGVPFLVNIHGTGGGSAENFPIGISQLMETYSGRSGMLSGSDFYLGDLTLRNVTDLYLVNAFMDAVHDDDQPLTSLEFDAGHADYGDDLSDQTDGEAVGLKWRWRSCRTTTSPSTTRRRATPSRPCSTMCRAPAASVHATPWPARCCSAASATAVSTSRPGTSIRRRSRCSRWPPGSTWAPSCRSAWCAIWRRAAGCCCPAGCRARTWRAGRARCCVTPWA
ncbi:beta-galactosidase [Streptomyces halotolerans]|uniref:Beta-galactosidase n=1 Tax=Streptomyces pratisoli TaxID=3139917 RepID=A0ACC6QAK6_9ACTN